MLLALLIGLTALFEMRDSWRIGIKHGQKTDLVTSGIYSISRNPYFLSYEMLFLGIFLIFPSLLLLVLTIGLIVTFHQMVLEEEIYLEKMQGEPYLQYKNKVGRYIFNI
jgi:protein-S-isoprenylcysteine O-methyltransferase Ste14